MKICVALAAILIAVTAPQAQEPIGKALREIVRQCDRQLPLSPAGCECIAERASTYLNLDQQRLLIARVTRNANAEAALNLSQDEIQEVIVFIRTAPDLCGP